MRIAIFTKKSMRFFALFLLFPFYGITQRPFNALPNRSDLVLKEIMKGNEFIGHQPENVRWDVSGKKIIFDWNPDNNAGNSTYVLDYFAKGADPQKVKGAQVPISYDREQHKFEKQFSSLEGVLVSIDKKTGTLHVVYQTNTPIRNIQRLNDPRKIAFQQGNNLFLYDEFKGSIQQLTNFLPGDEKQQKDSTFLMKEELNLFDYHKDQQERKIWRETEREAHFKQPKAVYFGKATIDNIQLSPDGKFVSYRLTYDTQDKETEFTQFISSDGQAYTVKARSKVSDNDPTHKLGIVDLAKDSSYFIDLSQLSDLRKKPAYLNNSNEYEKDRAHIMHSLKFNPNGKIAVFDIRSYDNKDRWIVLLDLAKGELKELEKQHDEAWIGGPGISSWNMAEGTLGWLKDNSTIFFQSEESGFSHLYTFNILTNSKSTLTQGKWEVHDVTLSHDGKKFYLTTNQSHPGDRNFMQLEIDSKKLSPVLSRVGYFEVSMSPDEKHLAYRYSYKNKPWELYVCLNTAGTKEIQITKSTTKAFDAYNWREPEVITFKGSDGIDVYARLYKPSTETANSTAVLFVHGAGYLQNAHNYWSTYHREFMFNNLLADNGFTVLDIDYRASEGYGRDYRTAIYRHMGGRDLQDHIDGKKFLVDNYNIDPDRIGIYGGSYGGFITLMGMLSTPGEFHCGAALRSVTDWAHYNHEYTSNILNYPGSDPEAYRKSSPIYYADGLQGKLLMLHGMVDDNVQFQDVVRLSQRFIELGKENWELAVFPVEAHGFKEAYSWHDEYRRIYELFYNELLLKHRK
jgi:dipeptidyl aminopeptidase/acylaminoacyl peptidase